jgi:hypothetical protein
MTLDVKQGADGAHPLWVKAPAMTA